MVDSRETSAAPLIADAAAITPAVDRRDTIIALSSGKPPSGVAVIRASGPQALVALKALAGSVPEPRRARLHTLRDLSGEPIDSALVLAFPSPASFTGEDVAEFQVHGGPAVVQALLLTLTSLAGCRMARAGEFSLRAFLNGKADLTELEGLADLIDAETESQRRLAVRQAGGAQRALYEGWRMQMLRLRALLEADLDFSDEQDVPGSVLDTVRSDAAALRQALLAHAETFSAGEIIREGFRVVLVGPPNAGKSALLNALAQRDVAIVTPIAGTTRDVITVALDLGGEKVIVSDTAGLRQTDDTVERIGIERSYASIDEAHLVLSLAEDGAFADISHPSVVRVASKTDIRPDSAQLADVAISTITGDGMMSLISLISDRAAAVTRGGGDGVIVSRLRHRDGISRAAVHLDRFDDALGVGVEFAAEELRLAGQSLAEVTGAIGTEDVLGAIFSSFCIGK